MVFQIKDVSITDHNIGIFSVIESVTQFETAIDFPVAETEKEFCGFSTRWRGLPIKFEF